MEKFLFYRGVGNFGLPFTTRINDAGVVSLTNGGEQPLTAALLVDINGQNIRVASLSKLAPGKTQDFAAAQPVSIGELEAAVVAALKAEGLYEKEALSMVATWKQSWFAEQGTRVLYMVPQPLTDELLPLTISPAPTEKVRVLVGRMEVMSPEAEQQMMTAVARSAQARSAHNEAEQGKEAKDRTPFVFPEEIRQLGRLTEPALVRVSTIAKDAKVRAEATILLQQLNDETPAPIANTVNL